MIRRLSLKQAHLTTRRARRAEARYQRLTACMAHAAERMDVTRGTVMNLTWLYWSGIYAWCGWALCDMGRAPRDWS